MLPKRFARRLAVVLLLLAMLLVGVGASTAATADRFYISRLIAWREADFHDFERFPSRPVPAGSKAFSFKPAHKNPPEYLRTVTYRRDAPDAKTPARAWLPPLTP